MKYVLNIGACVLAVGALLVGARGCNMAFNNKTLNGPTYTSVNHAKGLSGHIEYTRYADGSQDVKEYPNFGRLFDSTFHQDLDGDGLVDRIRRNAGEWESNRLEEFLVREHDYKANKEKFDEADEQLRELMARYTAKK